MRDDLIEIAYLVAAFCFILGLRWLSSPRTARKGNLVAAVGMLIAIVATLVDGRVVGYTWIAIAAFVGGSIGALVARRVQMTAMPQLVALLNGLGGGAAALIAVSEYHVAGAAGEERLGAVLAVSVMFSAIVGSISFAGSLVAFGKLQELLPGRPITWPAQKLLNGLGAVVVLGLAAYASFNINDPLLWLAAVLALLLGVSAVLPIGGADMPVVIAFLNACTGLAAAATGFALGNSLLIIAGVLVGASGTLLTQLMSKAMNRSVANVLFGAFGGGGGSSSGVSASGEALPVLEISASDLAAQLVYARRVMIVPGYGLAVAQAQHPVRELADLLIERGVSVAFAIHPVAGRMPGHMNVLLAEADVPYDQLLEMEEANPDFPQTDIVLVIGANDVVNPAARDDENSPLYGMPILEVDNAENVIVFKRSMASGFAGVENMLFHDPKTRMLFGDARKSLTQLVQDVQAV
ncbi:MAG: NAD(P)(+) transhydrogenase (Re/Si-specific) subunit beta [Thermoleophilia bacterium]|nr:NAD(P)(+) transhydrogenase (Re/Si-specific) subunit beta [Thermoleophilia bacterium]MBJ7333449.1 NAD(P)(+) transhydrogenase (Re/Si-specific) subunit beta [Thermoleophilia bacterium]